MNNEENKQQSVQDTQHTPTDHITINTELAKAQSNPLGTAGFILALLDLFLGWIPVLGWIMWFLGAVFSIIGVFKTPKGLAIAGTIISFIDIIVILTIVQGLAGLGSML